MAGFLDEPAAFQGSSAEETPARRIELAHVVSVAGAVSGASVLDVACGDGRLTRRFAEAGAASVVGVDIAATMIARAEAATALDPWSETGAEVRFHQVSAASRTWQLDPPADLVVAMDLLNHAAGDSELGAICRFVGRNVTPGGRFVCACLAPSFDFKGATDDLETLIGIRPCGTDQVFFERLSGGRTLRLRPWSRSEIESSLRDAGLADIKWHPITPLASEPDLTRDLEWYFANPSAIVLSATRTLDA
ncbi:MAG: methyltransferase domain-containing protein [Pseudomonadota bacterium]